MEKPLIILLRMADSSQPHMDNLRFMVLMVDDNITISMPELNDEDFFLYHSQKIMNINKFLVMMTLLNSFQMMNICLILGIVFHPKIRTDWEVKYSLCWRGISLYYRIIIPGHDTCCLCMPRHMHMQR